MHWHKQLISTHFSHIHASTHFINTHSSCVLVSSSQFYNSVLDQSRVIYVNVLQWKCKHVFRQYLKKKIHFTVTTTKAWLFLSPALPCFHRNKGLKFVSQRCFGHWLCTSHLHLVNHSPVLYLYLLPWKHLISGSIRQNGGKQEQPWTIEIYGLL